MRNNLEIYIGWQGLCVHIYSVLIHENGFFFPLLTICFLVEDHVSLYIEFFLSSKWLLLGKKSRHF